MAAKPYAITTINTSGPCYTITAGINASDEVVGTFSTATTESTVQWLLHRRMRANQQMRWSPRDAT